MTSSSWQLMASLPASLYSSLECPQTNRKIGQVSRTLRVEQSALKQRTWREQRRELQSIRTPPPPGGTLVSNTQTHTQLSELSVTHWSPHLPWLAINPLDSSPKLISKPDQDYLQQSFNTRPQQSMQPETTPRWNPPPKSLIHTHTRRPWPYPPSSTGTTRTHTQEKRNKSQYLGQESSKAQVVL